MAAEEGSERESTGGLGSMDSLESRWVFQDEYDSAIDEGEEGDDEGDLTERGGVDSELEDDNLEQRLIRTGPRVDSFDVEALEIPGAQRLEYEDYTLGRKTLLALQTLGVVFGDVGTSPLYTFSVIRE